MNKDNAVLKVNKYSFSVDKQQILKDIEFEIKEGDFVALLGPNGAGKTTLLRHILKLDSIDKQNKNAIKLFGTQQHQFTDWWKIAYLPQKYSNINTAASASVMEIINLGLIAKFGIFYKPSEADQQQIDDIMIKLNILKLKNKLFSELSGGQQQKVMLARALIKKPQLLILDEPSSALDHDSKTKLLDIIDSLNKRDKVTIIIVSHDISNYDKFVNKLLYIENKQIYFGGLREFCESEDMTKYFGASSQHLICHQH